jgi:hypothetical protein
MKTKETLRTESVLMIPSVNLLVNGFGNTHMPLSFYISFTFIANIILSPRFRFYTPENNFSDHEPVRRCGKIAGISAYRLLENPANPGKPAG